MNYRKNLLAVATINALAGGMANATTTLTFIDLLICRASLKLRLDKKQNIVYHIERTFNQLKVH